MQGGRAGEGGGGGKVRDGGKFVFYQGRDSTVAMGNRKASVLNGGAVEAVCLLKSCSNTN